VDESEPGEITDEQRQLFLEVLGIDPAEMESIEINVAKGYVRATMRSGEVVTRQLADPHELN